MIRRLKNDHRLNLTVAITPDSAARQRQAWANGVTLIGQGRGDLGERMARVFRKAPPGPVIVIGSDIPTVTKAHLLTAAQDLAKADAIFGPSGDGGYWLVGMKRLKAPNHNLFRSVRWSSRHALSDSCASFAKTDVVSFTASLDDIDDGVSYRHWKAGNR